MDTIVTVRGPAAAPAARRIAELLAADGHTVTTTGAEPGTLVRGRFQVRATTTKTARTTGSSTEYPHVEPPTLDMSGLQDEDSR